ncbi:MAG: nucleotidyltransferase, partial [Verrucomicrobiota bacterium]|nr:nucleotidyltransferase [Verrucomicrobiota bacterium]
YKKMVAELNTYQGHEGVATSMVGYILGKTLSQHGTVNRGLCGFVDGKLKNVEEFTNIREDDHGALHGDDPSGRRIKLNRDAIVSMNFWGFNNIFEPLEIHFEAFLRARGTELLSEYYLPSFVDTLIKEKFIDCSVIETESQWFGVTYPGDKASVTEGISKLTNSGYC